MRVAIFAQDDEAAAACLGPLAERGFSVLCIAGPQSTSVFARQALELGFGFVTSKEPAVADAALQSFQAELSLSVPDVGERPAGCKYSLSFGGMLKGAPWPEFAPIWLGADSSRVVLTSETGEVASASVPVSCEDTAISLRTKHAAKAAQLFAALLDGGVDSLPKEAAKSEVAGSEAPSHIKLNWDEDTVDRYIRAYQLPPYDAAVVQDPVKGDTYFIESMEQYKVFRSTVLNEVPLVDKDGTPKAYAADTHWYSNVGGSIVKLGDSDVHKPVRTTDKKRQAVIPGAAIASSSKKLRMNEPLIGPNAERYSSTALSSGWIGVEGPYIRQFERHLAQICGCKAACAVQSGTAALYGAMKALGVSDASHHVLVPSFTCAACADAIVHAGGRPIPVDCDLDSYAVSLEAVKAALATNKDVIGMVIAPCYGVPARDFAAILALCKEKGLWICEDACETYGASATLNIDGQGLARVPVGSQATLCVLSVRSEKMIGVGEGGAILGNDVTLVARAKWWCSRAPSRGAGLWRVYKHDAVGQNFRMPEMLAAVGCAAAEMLPLMKERKRAIHGWYEKGLATRPALKAVTLQKEAEGDESVWWLNAALLPAGMSGEKVGMQLMKIYPNIEIRPGFFPLNMMEIFQSAWVQPCPNAELLYDRLVCLPSSNQLTEKDIEQVCDALVEAIGLCAAPASS